MKVVVLRLGHRISRDPRLSTHVMLTARAFGADELVYTGDKDERLFKTTKEVIKNWGGNFNIRYENNWKTWIKKMKEQDWKVVHLTMYGAPVLSQIRRVRESCDKVIIIVGGQKVPGEVYGLADWNVSVANQPHSEVSALAILLHEIFQGKELERKFKNPEIEIIPSKKGKKIIKKSSNKV